MIPKYTEIKEKYLDLLPVEFFNKDIPNIFKADSGLTVENDNVITNLCQDLEIAFIDFTKSCKVVNVKVNGGGGAPGTWSGGLGVEGGIDFIFDLKIKDYYDYTLHFKRNRIFENEINKIILDVFSELVFNNLKFGTGVSNHTTNNPGSLSNGVSIVDTLNNVSQVINIENIKHYKSLDAIILEKLNNDGFSVLEYIQKEMFSLKKLLHYLIEFWINNTKISNVIASGGLTSAGSGTLANGIASGGLFI